MKNRAFVALTILVIVVPVGGCALPPRPPNAPVIPPLGWLYTSYKAPLEVNYQGSDFGTRVGRAKTHYICIPGIITGIPIDIAWGDAAMRDAAKDGGITHVKGADYEFLQVIGLYAELTVHCYGD